MFYRTHDAGMATAPRRTVDAHSLLHLKLPKSIRSVDAADLVDGFTILQNQTLRLAAAAYGVSIGSVARARRLTPEQRQAVRQGRRPLVLPRAPVPPKPVPVPNIPAPSPVAMDVRQRLIAIVNEIGGIDAALDVLAAGSIELAA